MIRWGLRPGAGTLLNLCWILFAYRTLDHRAHASWRLVYGATRRALHACVWHRWTQDMLCKRMNRQATWRWLCCLSLPILTRCWRWLCCLSLAIVTRGADYVVSFFPLWLVPDGSMDRTPLVLLLSENYTSISMSLNIKRHIICLIRHTYFFRLNNIWLSYTTSNFSIPHMYVIEFFIICCLICIQRKYVEVTFIYATLFLSNICMLGMKIAFIITHKEIM